MFGSFLRDRACFFSLPWGPHGSIARNARKCEVCLHTHIWHNLGALWATGPRNVQIKPSRAISQLFGCLGLEMLKLSPPGLYFISLGPWARCSNKTRAGPHFRYLGPWAEKCSNSTTQGNISNHLAPLGQEILKLSSKSLCSVSLASRRLLFVFGQVLIKHRTSQ